MKNLGIFMLNETLLAKILQASQEVSNSGPRYTSYPTVPEWNTWGTEEYQNILNQVNSPEFSLYVHFPYCKTKCLFCACNAYVSNNPETRGNYLKHLMLELKMLSPYLANKNIHHLHLGGGTPTYLSTEELHETLCLLHNQFKFSINPERSVEIDPRTINREKLELLKGFGFNRVSFGIQDFDPRVQKFINRHHTFSEISEIIHETRLTGINNINLDIIYGLNYQTIETWQTTLKSVLNLKPTRIAAYSYANVPWKKKHQLALKEGVVTPEEKLKMLLLTKDFFINNGYMAIGMDHFALPEDPLAIAYKNHQLYRNFMGYTDRNQGDYFGVGCSSIGWTSDAYFQNTPTPVEYIKKINAKKFATFKGKYLSKDDKIRQKVIQEIMNYGKVNFAAIETEFEIDFKNYFHLELIEVKKFSKLAEIEKSGITLTETGTYLTRNIAMLFDEYLKKSLQNKFSSTI